MAAGNTYESIATQTLVSNAATVTFSSIPSTYTDLVLVANWKNTGIGNISLVMRYNGDTATNYSITDVYGNGTSALSARANSIPYIYLNFTAPATTYNATYISNVMNYANTTTYKTSLNRSSAANGGTEAIVGLWRSTSAITSITYSTDDNLSSLGAGSIFSLYGIKAA